MAGKILINPEGKVLVSNSGCSLCGMLKNKPGYQQGRSFVGYGIPAGVPCDMKSGASTTLFRWTVDYDTCIWYEDMPGARVWLTLENVGRVHVLGVEEIGTQLCLSGSRAVNALGMRLAPSVTAADPQTSGAHIITTDDCDTCNKYKVRTGWLSVTDTFRRVYQYGPHQSRCPDVTCEEALVFSFTPQNPPGCVWYEESGYVRVWFGLDRGELLPEVLGVEDLDCKECEESSSSSSIDCAGEIPHVWVYNDRWDTGYSYYAKDPPPDPIPHTQEYKWHALMGEWPFSFENSQTIILEFNLRYNTGSDYRCYVFLDGNLWHVLDSNSGTRGLYILDNLSGVHLIEFFMVYMQEMDGVHYHQFNLEYTLKISSIDARCYAYYCAQHPEACAGYVPAPPLPAEEDEFE